MIEFIRNWCESLVIAVAISIIIEMLLPEGNNKKYVKVVIGIYIIFVIISPICEITSFKTDFKSILNFKELDSSSNIKTSNNLDEYTNGIRQVYLSGIENSIKEEVTNLGYLVDSVKIFANSDYSNIEKIQIKIISKNEKNDNNINIIKPVVIEKENFENDKYEDIINYLSEKYFIKKENIVFKK